MYNLWIHVPVELWNMLRIDFLADFNSLSALREDLFSCVFMRGSILIFFNESSWLCVCTKLYFCTYVDLLVSLKCNRNWAHKEFNLQTPYLVLTEKIISLQSWFWKVCQTESVGVAIYCFCALRLKSILRCKWANVQFLTLVCIQRNNREWWW